MNPSDDTQRKEKKELFQTLDKLRNEINSFRNELNKINEEKESWFSKKNDFSRAIREKISHIKEDKAKRDALTNKVKELKKKRDASNQESRRGISELKKLKEEVGKLSKKSKIKDPYRIKGEIDKTEVKLETEAMSFDKEKELSKKLKQLKKSLSESSEISGIFNKVKKLNLEIDVFKKNTNETHNEVQKLAKESQEMHENIIKNSKEIDAINVKEDEAFKNFSELKKKFIVINDQLKEKLSEMGSLREKIHKFKLEEDEERKLKESAFLQGKEQEIEEKIKTGKKLTTDDFLLFQEAIKKKEK